VHERGGGCNTYADRGTNIARQVEVPLHNNSLQPTPRTAPFANDGSSRGILRSKSRAERGGSAQNRYAATGFLVTTYPICKLIQCAKSCKSAGMNLL
jgi:hypothetical protein